MAAGNTARTTHFPHVHYARMEITFEDDAIEYELVTLPAGALILDMGVYVATAFNDSGTETLEVGYADDKDEYLDSVALGTAGRVYDATVMNASVELNPQTVRTILVKWTGQNSDATAGRAIVWCTYIPDTQGAG